jgi:hypothetical protein
VRVALRNRAAHRCRAMTAGHGWEFEIDHVGARCFA